MPSVMNWRLNMAYQNTFINVNAKNYTYGIFNESAVSRNHSYCREIYKSSLFLWKRWISFHHFFFFFFFLLVPCLSLLFLYHGVSNIPIYWVFVYASLESVLPYYKIILLLLYWLTCLALFTTRNLIQKFLSRLAFI